MHGGCRGRHRTQEIKLLLSFIILLFSWCTLVLQNLFMSTPLIRSWCSCSFICCSQIPTLRSGCYEMERELRRRKRSYTRRHSVRFSIPTSPSTFPSNTSVALVCLFPWWTTTSSVSMSSWDNSCSAARALPSKQNTGTKCSRSHGKP